MLWVICSRIPYIEIVYVFWLMKKIVLPAMLMTPILVLAIAMEYLSAISFVNSGFSLKSHDIRCIRITHLWGKMYKFYLTGNANGIQ